MICSSTCVDRGSARALVHPPTRTRRISQVNLGDRRPEELQYLGASFGVTAPLLGFWQRAGYLPVYLRQTPSEVSTSRLPK